MQILKIDFSNLKFSRATPDKAEKIVMLYRQVYGADYPCPELFTKEGMIEFLDFAKSNAVTMIIQYNEEVIAAATCQLHGRLVYSRGFMVDPVWQGKINSRRAFQYLMLLFRNHFKGRADLVYGEARTETTKIQNILEEIGCFPVAILPRKDIFYGKRESEIISVWYYQMPQAGPLNLTFKASQVAAGVLHHPVSYVETLTPLNFDDRFNFNVTERRDKYGNSEIIITLPSGEELNAILSYKSKNSEKVEVSASDDYTYFCLLYAFLREIRLRDLEYSEIYIDARENMRQQIVETLGFRPTGFLVHWFANHQDVSHDYVVYTKHWSSILPDCPVQFTEQGKFLRKYIEPPSYDETIPQKNGIIFERLPGWSNNQIKQIRVSGKPN